MLYYRWGQCFQGTVQAAVARTETEQVLRPRCDSLSRWWPGESQRCWGSKASVEWRVKEGGVGKCGADQWGTGRDLAWTWEFSSIQGQKESGFTSAKGSGPRLDPASVCLAGWRCLSHFKMKIKKINHILWQMKMTWNSCFGIPNIKV